MKNIFYTILDIIIGAFLRIFYLGLAIGLACIVIKIFEFLGVFPVFVTILIVIANICCILALGWLLHEEGYDFRTSLMNKLECRRGKKNE